MYLSVVRNAGSSKHAPRCSRFVLHFADACAPGTNNALVVTRGKFVVVGNAGYVGKLAENASNYLTAVVILMARGKHRRKYTLQLDAKLRKSPAQLRVPSDNLSWLSFRQIFPENLDPFYIETGTPVFPLFFF